VFETIGNDILSFTIKKLTIIIVLPGSKKRVVYG
jgi:hypothetical protein